MVVVPSTPAAIVILAPLFCNAFSKSFWTSAAAVAVAAVTLILAPVLEPVAVTSFPPTNVAAAAVSAP